MKFVNTPQLSTAALHFLLELVLGEAGELPAWDRARWNEFFEIAERAAVGPTVAAAILKLPANTNGAAVPRDLARARAQDAAAVASAWQADLQTAAVACLRVGVTPIALKGAALAAHRIVGPEARHIHDIDLLIPGAESESCREAFLDAGCVEMMKDPLPAVDGLSRAESSWRDPQIAFACIGPFGTPIEVHRIASRISGGTYSELAVHCVPAALEGADVLVPSVHRLRRMLNEHVFVSHLADPRLLLRHVADLAAIERWGDGRVKSATINGKRVDERVGEMLLRLAHARADDSAAVTRAQHFFLCRDGDDASRVERLWHLLEALEVGSYDLRHRPLFLLRRIFPHRRYMAALYGLPEDQAWLPSVHLKRWMELRHGLAGGRGRQ